MKKKLISIVIPVYNEEATLGATYSSLLGVLHKQSAYDFEVIIVNDGSSDNTSSIAEDLKDKTIGTTYIEFSRNFGKEPATSAGINESRGDAVLMVDADGQHPVEMIPNFIEEWRKGYQVVVGVRSANKGEGFIKRVGSTVFYKILNAITDGNTVPSSTDFRLIDRQVVDEFNKLTERGRITRGLIDWLGFKRTYIEFTANERVGGEAAYSVKKLARLALHAFVSQSTKPLQAVGLLGIIIMLLSFLLGVSLIFEKYVLSDPMNLGISGTAFLAIFLTFLVGIVLACQGLLSLYIESIHNETQNRPLYIIAKKN